MRLIGTMLLVLLLGGCAMVNSSVLERAEGFTCDSSAGAYFLPKTVMLAEVIETLDDVTSTLGTVSATQKRRNFALQLSYRRIPDQRFAFCLDYLTSLTSDDIVHIKKHRESHLLYLVSTDSIDETRYIAQTLIRAAFILASGDANFGSGFGSGRNFADGTGAGRKVTVFKGEFDPFDAERAAAINESMKDFGFCLVMPAASFNRGSTGIDSYCEHPRRALHQAGAPNHQYRHTSGDGVVERGRRRGEGGVFYRPRVPHAVHAYIKDNFKVPHWRLAISRVIEMENISPVVAVGIERTAFAQRRTTLSFNEGQLEGVCIKKGSELLEASYIPLQLAQSIVQLPTSIVQVKINTADKSRALVAAEQQLLKTQNEHLAFLADLEKDPKSARAPARNSNTLDASGKTTGEYERLETSLRTNRETDPDGCPLPTAGPNNLQATGLNYQNVIAPPTATNPNTQ